MENTEKVAPVKDQAKRDAEIVGFAKRIAAFMKEDTGMDLTGKKFGMLDRVDDGTMARIDDGHVWLSREAYELTEEYGRLSGIRMGTFVLSMQLFQNALSISYPHVALDLERPELDEWNRAQWILETEAMGRLFALRCVYDMENSVADWREHSANYNMTVMTLGIAALDERIPGFALRFDPSKEVTDASNSFRSSKSFIPYLTPRMDELGQLDGDEQQAYSTIMSCAVAILLSPSREAAQKNIGDFIKGEQQLEEQGRELKEVLRPGADVLIIDPDWRYN